MGYTNKHMIFGGCLKMGNNMIYIYIYTYPNFNREKQHHDSPLDLEVSNGQTNPNYDKPWDKP